jgi:tetratricopeptide (TPR) repeat protein
MAYVDEGQFKKATSILEKSLSTDDPHHSVSGHDATNFDTRRQTEESILERVMAIWDKHPENQLKLAAQYRLAMQYRRNGQYEKAIPILERLGSLEKIFGDDEDALLQVQLQLLIAYHITNQPEKAVAALEHAVLIKTGRSISIGVRLE